MEYKISDHESFRIHIRNTFATMLELKLETAAEIKLVDNLEKSIYNYSILEATKRNIIKKWENSVFVHLYVDRLRSIYTNLKNKDCELMSRLKSGDILPQQVAFMTHQEFSHRRWQSLLEEQHKRQACKFNTEIQASTDVYQCKRCKSRKCIYTEQQVRSADESMTIFVTCLDCGKQWRT